LPKAYPGPAGSQGDAYGCAGAAPCRRDYRRPLIKPDHRAAFLDDAERAFEAAELPEDERDIIRRQDWRALIHRGASFFVLEKLAAVTGVSNLHVYAAMRGQSLEDFMKTRNAPGALYSVAAKTVNWD
jgi:gallate dioxygenase